MLISFRNEDPWAIMNCDFQVRMEGSVQKVYEEESEQYFQSSSRKSNWSNSKQAGLPSVT